MKSKYVKNLVASTGVYNLNSVVSDNEGNFPPGEIIKKDGYNYMLDEKGLTDEEVNTALLAKQTNYLKTIKNIAVFYLIAGLTSATLYIILLLINLSK